MAFVGDALFNRGVGRTDLPGGDFAQLESSIREQIYTLPDATVVYSGHGSETTVGEEKEEIPLSRMMTDSPRRRGGRGGRIRP